MAFAIWMGPGLMTREDDSEPVIRQRLEEYESQTKPLLEYFEKLRSYPFHEVNGSDGPPQAIANRDLRLDRGNNDHSQERRGAGAHAPERAAGLEDPAGSRRRWSQEGVTTQDLEVAAEKMMKDAGAKPAFKGYYTQAAGSKYPVRAVHVGE